MGAVGISPTGEEYLSREILRHGAYVCVRPLGGSARSALARAAIEELADRFGLANEFTAAGGPPADSIAFLRRQTAVPGAIADEALQRSEAVIHVASKHAEPVAGFCAEARRLLAPHAEVRLLGGVVRPRNYTGAAMEKFAYARAVTPQPGPAMPNAFLIPMSKTAEWWGKDWMERHTYFLPRYDEEGRLVAEGHALVSEAGIRCLLRRTYHALEQPAPAGAYDFLTYFECADADVPVFEKVCAGLRDVKRNPEWKFVREGPTWHGRRVAAWPDALDARG